MKTKLVVFSIMAILFTCFFPNPVQASTTFYEGEYIPNLWIKKEKDNKIRYQQARFLRRGGDHQFAYCIEPWAEISNQVNYDDWVDINSINDETLEKIALIAYYGYGYSYHSDSKWYYITQVLIWREVDKTASFYFTDQLNGNKITTYDREMNEILNLVAMHQKRPNFSIKEVELLLGTKGTIIDVNNVLDSYQIINTQDNVTLDKQGNRINIDTLKIGNSNILLERKDSIYGVAPIVYRHPVNQNFLTVGSFKPISVTLPIHVVGGKIELEKVDANHNNGTPSGDASLLGSVFELYNSKKELVKTITLDQKTKVTITDLTADTYTIKEKEAGTGYLLNEEEIAVTLDHFHKTASVLFKNKVIENQITIEKFYGKENGPWHKEEGITFSIYRQDQTFLTEITTNQEGLATIRLPYGSYLIKQKNGKQNYEKIEDFTIHVTKDQEKQTFQKYNKEKLGKVMIIKLDQDTNSTIRENSATFTLINKETKEELGTYQTNEEGILKIENLSFGTYQLKEKKAPEGYQPLETSIEFTIEENHQEIILEIYNQPEITPPEEIIPKEEEEVHEIEVPNTSKIEINFGKELYHDSQTDHSRSSYNHHIKSKYNDRKKRK